MPTLEIEESDYKTLQEAAELSGSSIEDVLRALIQNPGSIDSWQAKRRGADAGSAKSRFAELARRIREAPPLQGVSQLLRESSIELRDEFAIGSTEDNG